MVPRVVCLAALIAAAVPGTSAAHPHPEPPASARPALQHIPAPLLAAPALNREARLVHRVAPRYPDSALRRGLEGWVHVSFVVDRDGRVREAGVVEASPEGAFDRAALRAVQRWRYRPRLIEGQPVAQREDVIVQFRCAE